MEAKYYTRQNLIIALIVGILIGLGAYYLWDNKETIKLKKNSAPATENAADNAEIRKGDGGVSFIESANSIVAPNQPAGYRIILSTVTMANDGWVVIHEDANGVPGNVLGAQRFSAGAYKDGTVELLRNTVEGDTYYAMIHTDDGDKMFDLVKDTPVKNSHDTPIMTAFNVVPVR